MMELLSCLYTCLDMNYNESVANAKSFELDIDCKSLDSLALL